ncbi:MAG: rRNA maturation factor [Gammaproteobacteria bacterium]|nr:rRNA maturation factor [Gammaproteobacteria bacterium]
MSHHHHIVLHNKTDDIHVPNIFEFNRWCHEALSECNKSIELTVCIVDEKEMADLNQQYRHKNGPTNVLAFPFGEMPKTEEEETALLGDLVICSTIIEKEAKEQGKALFAHWAHITVHGTLHLLGHDHQTEEEAAKMEALETAILARLHIENPYKINDNMK